MSNIIIFVGKIIKLLFVSYMICTLAVELNPSSAGSSGPDKLRGGHISTGVTTTTTKGWCLFFINFLILFIDAYCWGTSSVLKNNLLKKLTKEEKDGCLRSEMKKRAKEEKEIEFDER
ncbi:hypothetical protein IEQ34_000717 [Dendrobium chrysotoxum]|uniref:Uncharacterized protein n=1 Tax=Dendrobium chrysotoxum TaxID=161865 RepID=A0AAV7HRZ5_DENCH|nr:hypothetical protein IEQ34_000717 [Dendrobium chrysotoxum]